jgi:nucleotide-binding universal stress UspA family protein
MTACHDSSSWERRQPVAPLRFHHIVVGVDGSPNSLAALSFAVALGVRDNASVEVVCAYQPQLQVRYPFAPALPPYGPAGDGSRGQPTVREDLTDARADAQLLLERAMHDVFGDDHIDKVTLRPIDGHPQEVLIRMASAADLLVVGAHGHAGPLGMVIGSTAQAVTKHASCAVLVVPAPHQ